jgi:hypothetical protein
LCRPCEIRSDPHKARIFVDHANELVEDVEVLVEDGSELSITRKWSTKIRKNKRFELVVQSLLASRNFRWHCDLAVRCWLATENMHRNGTTNCGTRRKETLPRYARHCLAERGLGRRPNLAEAAAGAV